MLVSDFVLLYLTPKRRLYAKMKEYDYQADELSISKSETRQLRRNKVYSTRKSNELELRVEKFDLTSVYLPNSIRF